MSDNLGKQFISTNYGQTTDLGENTFNYSMELHEFHEALTPYGVIETRPPEQSIFTLDDFSEGTHFRTAPESVTNSLTLQLENRLLTIILDESGSMTWNDQHEDRYTYIKRLLSKLDSTYPGAIKANLIGFGGSLTDTNLFIAQSGSGSLSDEGLSFEQQLSSSFQDSVYDFAGVRVVRRTDRFPEHPADGVVVAEGIYEAVRDDDLSQGQTYYYGIWSFNKDRHYSTGQFIRGVPYDRILPQGVNFAVATPRILPGVERDSYTSLIYNFVENSGSLIFDSSGNGRHGSVGNNVILDNFWSGDSTASSYQGTSIKKSVGVRFDGEFDIIETTLDDTEEFYPGINNVTVNFWVYRYSNSEEQWVLGTSTAIESNKVGWAITVDGTGNVIVRYNDMISGISASLPMGIPTEEWTMVTIRMSFDSGSYNTHGYVNGSPVATSVDAGSTISDSDINTLYVGAKPETSGASWGGIDFFGILNQISIHGILRDDSYILNMHNLEDGIFNQNLSDYLTTPPDNLQREVLLNWEIGEDYDYEGGSVKIVRKYNELPTHDEDGEVIVELSAEPGEYFYMDSDDLTHGGDYYYRFYTINSIGNLCDNLESRVSSVRVPPSTDVSSDPPAPVTGETITPGNKKLLLQWSNPASDSRWVGTKVFFSNTQFPTANINSRGEIESDSEELIDTVKEYFAHRIRGKRFGSDVPLANGNTHFYTIVTYDQFGRISESRFLEGVPSSKLDTTFGPENVTDVSVVVVNPTTLSIQWTNPTLKSERLELYFGESAVCFASVRDAFGGSLSDVTNLKFEICSSFDTRPIQARRWELGNDSQAWVDEEGNPSEDPSGGFAGDSGTDFPSSGSCFSPAEAEQETILTYATVESGLVKGIVTHTSDSEILSRRMNYEMTIRSQYKVQDPEVSDVSLFEFNTQPVSVRFTHPIKIAVLNKLDKYCTVQPGQEGLIRGDEACPCSSDEDAPSPRARRFDGGYINAVNPYVVRVEIQYKGESLPDGTPVTMEVFSHRDEEDEEFLQVKSTRTSVQEGEYTTSSVQTERYDQNGNATGELISKSVVDIDIPHPSEPDWIDVYISINHEGFFVDGVHSVRFIGTLFIQADITKPFEDGIDVSEQFATVWTLDPDFPEDPTKTLPAPDGTVVKWELEKGQYGRDRPFYSTEELPNLISGVYSTTVAGIARNVFFGPVGDIEVHNVIKSCGEDSPPEECCIGEEYTIKASVILGEESAFDGEIFNYTCQTETFSNERFFINAHRDNPGQDPHWIAWGDGEDLLRFQIAANPVEVEVNPNLDMLGVSEYNSCVNNLIDGANRELPIGHIVQITAPGEILWDVTFDEDPYTGELTPISYQSISPQIAEDLGVPFIANIPIRGTITDFYIRYNADIGSANPKPTECSGEGLDVDLLNCQYRNICDPDDIGEKWDNVAVVSGRTTITVANKPVTMFAGGDYEDGAPPIKVGFKEPLSARVIEARYPNGEVMSEFVLNTRITFVVEVNFSNRPVPDGTPIDITVEGDGASLVVLSNCQGQIEGCSPSSGGVIYTRQINDFRLNPSGDKRSLAFFTIEPIGNVTFNAKINVTCRYDKLGTVEREVTRCIQLQNTVNVSGQTSPPEVGDDPEIVNEHRVTSNEAIVYDTVQDVYEKTRGAQVGRMGHFVSSSMSGTVDQLFLMGGYLGQGINIQNQEDLSTADITPYCEVFNSSTQEWSFIANMPTARCCGQTVEKDGTIYCIGGLSLDPGPVDRYIVSRKIESYDTRSGVWNSTLTVMPENYGIAFGDAQIMGDDIYVVCGIRSIVNNSQPGIINDRILKYSISNDSWDVIVPSNVLEYMRVSPFGFKREPVGQSVPPKIRDYYIYGGSIPRPSDLVESERNAEISKLLSEFRSSILTSSYYLNLPPSEQKTFVEDEEEKIRMSVTVPAFEYPFGGFRFSTNDEYLSDGILYMNISTSLESEWPVMPKARDRGQSIYVPHQDIAYFFGGSNQNQSATLNHVDSIDFTSNNQYAQLTPLSRGRALFGAALLADDVYFSGGLTSGHRSGWAQINIHQSPQYVEALGTQSSGLLISITNDSGEIIDRDIRVDVRGKIRIDALDGILSEFLANRAADRALGGDGSGTATDLPSEGDEVDAQRLIEAQNKIIDPNSDEFQFNSARKLGEQVHLFPIIYSQTEFVLKNGVGGVTLRPRSEDPLEEFSRLGEYINDRLAATPIDSDERFEGDLTREELAALGEVLTTVEIPPTIIESGRLRELYKIETVVTILDDFYFGQTVSEFDLSVQDNIESRIEELLTPPDADDGETTQDKLGGSGLDDEQNYGRRQDLSESECLVLENSAKPDIPTSDTPKTQRGSDQSNRSSPGGPGATGQCLFCTTVLPLAPDIRSQLNTVSVQYFNYTDWIPQIKKRLVSNTSSLSEVINEIDIIDHEIPFGGSQLYNAMFESGRIMSGETFDDVKKVIYICSDNAQNLSLVTRRSAIEEINSIDGEKEVPVVYAVFSTSFPVSLSAQLQQADSGDVVKITEETGGQSTTLTSTSFLDQILNLTLGSATGGLGYGIYHNTLSFDELTSLTSMTPSFYLPSNTQGYIRLQHSSDGYNFSDWSERFEGNQFIDFVDFFALKLNIEVVLTTGFTAGDSEEYDSIPTGIPKLINVVFDTSGEREDLLFVDKEDVLTNAQQVAVSFEGSLPTNAIIDVGACPSESHNWDDYHSPSQPSVREHGKIFLLSRTRSANSIVPKEPLDTKDQIVYTSTYGAWNPTADITIFEMKDDVESEVLRGYKAFPRQGQIMFDSRQDPTKTFSISIINDDKIRVGVRMRNRLHTDSITMSGIGYMYSTNDEKPPELSQVAPRAINVFVSPQSPTSSDTFFALYTYVDLNNDDEEGTIISWFRNGQQLFEVQNKLSWNNDNLLSEHKLVPTDKIHFTVTPSDGREFGETVYSPTVAVLPQEPGASDVRLVPRRDTVVNNRYDTSSIIHVEYEFNTDDVGSASLEQGTIIQWFVNGSLFKSGTFSETEPVDETFPITQLDPAELQAGVSAHEIGNQIYCEVTPKTIIVTGELVRSQVVTIENSIPIARNVNISPEFPSNQSTLTLSYELEDVDILRGIQTDQSEIKWYKSINGTDFIEQSVHQDSVTVPSASLTIGDYWYVTVTPFDALEVGAIVQSETKTIQ